MTDDEKKIIIEGGDRYRRAIPAGRLGRAYEWQLIHLSQPANHLLSPTTTHRQRRLQMRHARPSLKRIQS